MSRKLHEPGGVLLIGVGLDAAMLDDALAAHYEAAGSLTVLIDIDQQGRALKADEVWVYGALGLRGALALVRRIAWRRFTRVVQPDEKALPYLHYFVWPCPPWQKGIKQ